MRTPATSPDFNWMRYARFLAGFTILAPKRRPVVGDFRLCVTSGSTPACARVDPRLQKLEAPPRFELGNEGFAGVLGALE